MSVLLGSRLRSRRLRLPALRTLAARVLRAAGAARSSVSLLLVGDRTMRGLNRRYRRKDRTTDVLAFLARGAPPRTPYVPRGTSALLGDVVISLPQAVRQAKAAGHSTDREMTLLLIHGTLHLLGYDHERSARAARRMHRKERAVLRGLGRIPRLIGRPR